MAFSRHVYSGMLFDLVAAKIDRLGSQPPRDDSQEAWLRAVDAALDLALEYQAREKLRYEPPGRPAAPQPDLVPHVKQALRGPLK